MIEKYIRNPAYFENQVQDFHPILEGFLYKTETMMLFGGSGSGKSLFAFGLAAAYSNPDIDTFLDQPVGTGEVLYIDGEMHANSIWSRIEAFDAAELTSLHYLAMTEVVDDGKTVDLCEPGWQSILFNAVKKGQYNLVIIDSVRVLFTLDDENSARSWSPVNELIMSLRTLGCAVIVVHHSNKAALDGTGTNLFSGSTNAITVVDRTVAVSAMGESGRIFNVTPSTKQGRTEDGFGDWMMDCCFELNRNIKQFSLTDVNSNKVDLLLKYLANYIPDENQKNRARKCVRGVYSVTHATRPSDRIADCWKYIKDTLEDLVETGEIDEPFLPFNEEGFKDFIVEGSVQFETF